MMMLAALRLRQTRLVSAVSVQEERARQGRRSRGPGRPLQTFRLKLRPNSV